MFFPSQTSKPLTVIVPELYRRTGGVQVFSRNFVHGLDEILGSKVSVISMNDRRSDLPKFFCEHRRIATCGGLPSLVRKIVFSSRVLHASLRCRILTTHPSASRLLGILNRWIQTEYLVVAHGIEVWEIEKGSLAAGLRRAKRVLPVSRYTQEQIYNQLGEPLPKMTVFPNQVDTSRFTPAEPRTSWRKRLKISPEARVILTVSRLDFHEEKKGYDLVLDVVVSLRDDFPNLVWILAGTGSDLNRIRSRAEAEGISDRCRFPGFIEDAELPDLYRSVDVFLLPSQKEGFGIVFLEAASCGIPVVGGNRDGSVDALDGGNLGQLVDPTSPDEIENAVRRVFERSTQLPFHGDKAGLHAAVQNRFGRKRFEDLLGQILRDLKWL